MLDMEKVCIMGIEYVNLNLAEVADECFSYTLSRERKTVVTPNGEIAEYACQNEEFGKLLKEADLAIPDGVSIKIASKRAGTPIKERIPGVDLAQELIKKLNEKAGSLYLFGGAEGVAEEAAENILKENPNVKIVGMRSGYFSDDTDIIADITDASPDVLFVCLGSPKQETWMLQNRQKLSCGVMLGLGGTLDVLAGRVKRAPLFWRKIGCEWLYRTIKQPSRIKRILKIPVFVFRNKKNRRKNGQEVK